MNKMDILLMAVGRIEGEMLEIRKLNQRVSALEKWQAWLKGGWAAVLSMYVYLCRAFAGRWII